MEQECTHKLTSAHGLSYFITKREHHFMSGLSPYLWMHYFNAPDKHEHTYFSAARTCYPPYCCQA